MTKQIDTSKLSHTTKPGMHYTACCTLADKSHKPTIEAQKIKNAKRGKPYLDTYLFDFEGEEWRDVFGYDGIYSISNYGRVKSEQRYDSRGRLIKERILKQAAGANREPTVKLSVDNVKKTHRIMRMVGAAFLGDKDENFVYCHKNKIKTDNRLSNIIKVTRSESCEIDYKVGVKTDWGISTLIQDNVRDYLGKYGIYENGVLVRKVCINCHKEFPLNNFYKRKESGTYRRECKECSLKREGVQDVGKLINRIELAKNGLRYCTVCKELKNLDTDFSNSKTGYLGKSNTCKECSYKLHSKYIQEQKDIIGDFYVKQYALSNYGLKITDDEIEKYRQEIKEKRKPKYFIDGKSFLTIRDFARYIETEYGNPITMTEKRISDGASEKECIIQEKEYRSLKSGTNKGKVKVTDTVTGKVFEFKNSRDTKLLEMFSSSAITKAIQTGEPTRITKLSKYKNPCILERI